MAKDAHTVSSAREDLAAALNAAQGVRDIKVGKLALKKLVRQAEDLLEPQEKVEFGTYYYERGFTIVTYYVLLVTDRRIIRVNRTTWKLKPWMSDRAAVTAVEVPDGSRPPWVTLRKGETAVAPFQLPRADAYRLRDLLEP